MSSWDEMTSVERAVLTNAFESDILPGIINDIEDLPYEEAVIEAARTVLAFIEAGYAELRRYRNVPTPLGTTGEGLVHGELIPKAELGSILADPQTWEYPSDPRWEGALVLVGTPEGYKISHRVEGDEVPPLWQWQG